MRIRRQLNDGAEIINMSSLLDVMFILIIFLLATTTFKEEETDAQVALPSDTEGQPLSTQQRTIVINVRKSGAYVVLGRQVTVEEMAEIINDAVKEDENQKVLVRADQEALHGYVSRAISTCKHAGITKAHIGYQLLK
jgi:biopolymer transport protein ExbD